MQIGQVAASSGVSAKMIRHYEAIGLVAPAGRSQANYRAYGAPDVQRLAFIRRARALGFSIAQIRDLLRLWSDHHRSSAEVKRITLAHVAELDRRIADLRAMADTLKELADVCGGDKRPECPIITSLEGASAIPAGRASLNGGAKPARTAADPSLEQL